MTINEALEYAKKHGLEGIEVRGGYLIYRNSSGNTRKVKLTKGMLIYYRGSGKWAIYSPLRDMMILAHKIPDNLKKREKWLQYGDLNPPPFKSEVKVVRKAKVGRGKGKRKSVVKRVPKEVSKPSKKYI